MRIAKISLYSQWSSQLSSGIQMLQRVEISPIILNLCFLCTVISVCISSLCIFNHLMNYRKPLQQRVIIRILLIIPIYSTICYLNLVAPSFVCNIVEPIKEIYEAFVLYMFYCLLTDLLGGERNIIIMTAGRAPVKQPFPMSLFEKSIDISDPESFLKIKKFILQYVWLKPILCLMFAINKADQHNTPPLNNVSTYELRNNQYASSQEPTIAAAGSSFFLFSFGFWINVIYNISVSLSLYNLGLFWKCLYADLVPFNPWAKFLCVKLIIFASYWQGVLLAILNYFNFFKESSESIQNIVLCFELVGFAIGHWHAFSFKDFTIQNLHSSRLSFVTAFRDVIGINDLIYDFKITFKTGQKLYNFRNYESVDTFGQISHLDTLTRNKKLNQGMRYFKDDDGKTSAYWITDNNNNSAKNNNAVARVPSITSSNSVPNTSINSRSSNSSINGELQGLPADESNGNGDARSTSKELKKKKSKNKKLKSQLAQEKKVDHIRKATRELYRLDDKSTEDVLENEMKMSKEEFLEDNRLYIQAIRKKPFGDDNYPVISDAMGYIYSPEFRQRRQDALEGRNYGSISDV